MPDAGKRSSEDGAQHFLDVHVASVGIGGGAGRCPAGRRAAAGHHAHSTQSRDLVGPRLRARDLSTKVLGRLGALRQRGKVSADRSDQPALIYL